MNSEDVDEMLKATATLLVAEEERFERLAQRLRKDKAVEYEIDGVFLNFTLNGVNFTFQCNLT